MCRLRWAGLVITLMLRSAENGKHERSGAADGAVGTLPTRSSVSRMEIVWRLHRALQQALPERLWCKKYPFPCLQGTIRNANLKLGSLWVCAPSQDSLQRQQWLNKYEAERGGSATYGVNKFSDLTPQEFRGSLPTLPPSSLPSQLTHPLCLYRGISKWAEA